MIVRSQDRFAVTKSKGDFGHPTRLSAGRPVKNTVGHLLPPQRLG